MNDQPKTVVALIEDNPDTIVPIKSTLEELAGDRGYQYAWKEFDNAEDARSYVSQLTGPALVMVDMEILERGRKSMPAGFFILRDFAGVRPNVQWMAITNHRLLNTRLVDKKPLSALLHELPLLAVWYKDDYNDLRSHLDKFFESLKSDAKPSTLPRFMVSITPEDEFVTDDGRFYYQIEQAAKREVNLVLLGPVGSPRLRVAKSIHALSQRSGQKFTSFNCRELSPGDEQYLLQTILPTYAGGTLFADHYGALPDATRRNLIQQCSRSSKLNVRLILGAETKPAEGSLRSVPSSELPEEFSTILIPPLSDRPADVALLASRFLERRPTLPAKRFMNDPQIVSFLKGAVLPQNEADLERLLEHASTLRPGNVIDYEDTLRAYDDLFGLFGPLSVDPKLGDVRIAGHVVSPSLSKLEFSLLDHLMQNQNGWCTPDEIKRAVWAGDQEPSSTSDDALTQAVKRLRKAIDRYPKIHQYIRNERGRGYQFCQYRRTANR